MAETNLIMGVGIKPYIHELTRGGHYPLGSHSTLLGYFFKTGILGGTIILSAYIFTFFRYLVFNIKLFFTKKKYYMRSVLLETTLILALTISILEDFDSYEIIMLYFGFLIGMIINDKDLKYD